MSAHSCERVIEREWGKGWLTSGYRVDGERVTCTCGRIYVHVCDEAEGCFWDLHVAEPLREGT